MTAALVTQNRDGAGNAGMSRTKAVRGLVRERKLAVHLHENDLPSEVKFAEGPIAVDTEAMGLMPGRDRLCLVQLSDGKGDEHLVQFKRGSDSSAPNLKTRASRESIQTIARLRGIGYSCLAVSMVS